MLRKILVLLIIVLTGSISQHASVDLKYGDHFSINNTILLQESQLNIDNIQVDGNTISATNTSGDITVSPNVDGKVILNSYHKHAKGPIFRASVTGSLTNKTGDNTPYIIVFDTILFEIGECFNISDGKFSAPVSGYYLFTATVGFDGVTASHYLVMVSIGTNGGTSAIQLFDCNGANMRRTNDLGLTGSTIMHLDAGDTAYVQVQVNGSGIKDIDFETNTTSFSGFLISAD
ncbi:hypothetical protein ACFLZV_06495 [Candidatus Margulisiibacteriota bacterium]